MDKLAVIKTAACQAIELAADDLNEISRSLWLEPELAFQEKKAHELLTGFLERRGFEVTRHYILDTGFRASLTSSDTNEASILLQTSATHVGLMCEFDALPGVGHACGHNLIAEVALGAALGLQAVIESLPIGSRVTVFGTPAEEGGAGKVIMANGGAFGGLSAALMAHPYSRTEARPLILSRVTLVAEFKPLEFMANPTDAAVVAYQAISCMRAWLPKHCMVHGVLKNCDSPRPDITPRRAVLEYYLRAPNESNFADMRRRITDSFEAAAKATGCRVEVTQSGPAVQSLLNNSSLCEAYIANMRQLGAECQETASTEPIGSTDMGNVSHLVPSIHPTYRLMLDDGRPESAQIPANHSHEFARIAGDPAAQEPTLIQAKALAMTVIDILSAPTGGLRDQAMSDFERETRDEERHC